MAGNNNSKSVILGIFIGIIVAVASAVGMVLILSSTDGGMVMSGEKAAEVSDENEEANKNEEADKKAAKKDTEKDTEKDITEEVKTDAVSDDSEAGFEAFSVDYSSSFKGIDSEAKMEYLLGIAENCQNERNVLNYALIEIWYEHQVQDVYGTIEVTEDNYSKYDISELNQLFSFLTDESINSGNIPSVSSISDNNLCYKYNAVREEPKTKVKIKSIKCNTAGVMHIEYAYISTLGANKDSGVYGKSVAVCEKDSDGLYQFKEVKQISQKTFEDNKIDESFLEEY